MTRRKHMNNDTIQGQWKQIKGQVQAKWGELTGDGIDQIDGNRERLEGIVQERYGKSKDEAQREVDDFYRTL